MSQVEIRTLSTLPQMLTSSHSTTTLFSHSASDLPGSDRQSSVDARINFSLLYILWVNNQREHTQQQMAAYKS